MSKIPAVLFLFSKLAAVSGRPLQTTDVLDFIRTTLDDSLLPDDVSKELKWLDPSELFFVLTNLQARGYVLRTDEGWVINPSGRKRATAVARKLSSKDRHGVVEAAKVA